MHLTPIKAIRAKCLDCCCNHPSEVRICTAVKCPLYPYRMGKRPKTDIVTPEDGMEFYTPENPPVFVTEENESPLV